MPQFRSRPDGTHYPVYDHVPRARVNVSDRGKPWEKRRSVLSLQQMAEEPSFPGYNEDEIFSLFKIDREKPWIIGDIEGLANFYNNLPKTSLAKNLLEGNSVVIVRPGNAVPKDGKLVVDGDYKLVIRGPRIGEEVFSPYDYLSEFQGIPTGVVRKKTLEKHFKGKLDSDSIMVLAGNMMKLDRLASDERYLFRIE